MRVAVLNPLRVDHGKRLKKDRKWTALQLAFSERLRWARWAWLAPLRAAVSLFSRERLLDLGIIQNGEANIFLATKLEGMTRAAIGLQTRSMAIWQGGVYRLVRLTGSKRRETKVSREALALEAATCWRNFLAIRQACETQEEPEPALVTLCACFLWADQPVYREIHTLLAEGKSRQAKQYLWKVHSSHLHERGDPWAEACRGQFHIPSRSGVGQAIWGG